MRRTPRPRGASLLGAVLALGLASATVGTAVAVDESPAPDFERITEALEIIARHYVDPAAASNEELTDGAIRGLVEALGDDGHTVYLTPEEFQSGRDALDGLVTGIGVVVDRRAGTSRIISVIDGSPADRAGIRAGDVITTVGGQFTDRLPIDELIDLVRGDTGTTVRLGIQRAGEAERIEVTIERASVVVPPASWARVPGSNVAVVRIVQFSVGSGRETREAIQDVLATGATGIVLDLRGNPGGLVDEAIAVAGAFIAKGVAYQERGRNDQTVDVPIRGSLIDPDIPLVVLVDYGSASAAEILAAALRDNDRARLIGEQTYGTGTVLNTFMLSDGSALRLAVLDWLTPGGEHVFRSGLTPDEVVALPVGAYALDPGDLVGMTASDLERSDDLQFKHALSLLDPGP
jgi:carboxyl-terminal processing protease